MTQNVYRSWRVRKNNHHQTNENSSHQWFFSRVSSSYYFWRQIIFTSPCNVWKTLQHSNTVQHQEFWWLLKMIGYFHSQKSLKSWNILILQRATWENCRNQKERGGVHGDFVYEHDKRRVRVGWSRQPRGIELCFAVRRANPDTISRHKWTFKWGVIFLSYKLQIIVLSSLFIGLYLFSVTYACRNAFIFAVSGKPAMIFLYNFCRTQVLNYFCSNFTTASQSCGKTLVSNRHTPSRIISNSLIAPNSEYKKRTFTPYFAVV